MRSYREIKFRLRQELTNLRLLAHPPRLPQARPILAPLATIPVPDAAEIARLADEIRRRQLPLFERQFDFSYPIPWRRDAVSGLKTPRKYLRRIPYLDSKKAGDHKIIWELNRHQHLVVLAQAGDEASWQELLPEIESWLVQNPFQRGINWVSALEFAFRALSWIQIYQIAGNRMNPDFRQRFLEALYRHGLHLHANLSIYFSPNTHLLGEAVALHALGTLSPDFPGAQWWVETGRRWVLNEYGRQVRPDGSHFEQSSYYHVYALDMFLLHPYSPCALFGRDTLCAANTCLGRVPDAEPSRLFEDTGVAVMQSRQVLIDVGPFGPRSAGHSHSDTLNIVVRSGQEWLLIDPGTFTYVGDPELRAWFRGAGAHESGTLQPSAIFFSRSTPTEAFLIAGESYLKSPAALSSQTTSMGLQESTWWSSSSTWARRMQFRHLTAAGGLGAKLGAPPVLAASNSDQSSSSKNERSYLPA